MDLQAERDKIQQEIAALERSLGGRPAGDGEDVSEDDSDDDLEDELDGDLETDDVIWDDGGSTAERSLQMNLVYQAVIQEKLQEVELLISQNKEQQEELLWELAGRKTQRPGVRKPYPLNLSVGHFLKPYFKDKVTGLGPPANQEMIERKLQIVKTFKDLTSRKWRTSDNSELRKAIISDSLQRMLQPKLLKVDYLQRKRDRSESDIDKKIVTKQISETEREIQDINQLPEDRLLGKKTDDHDWDKISNINFEGVHSAERLHSMWQNYEHPHVNKERWSEEEVQKLQEIADHYNYVNWEAIAEELGTRRTAFQCLQVFQSNNKEFKRKEFTKEEDVMLTEFVQRMRVGEHIPYLKISYFMEGRDGVQVGCRWSRSLDPSLTRGLWSKEEDEMLLKAVARHGEKEWYKIRSEVPGRNDVQCRERYYKGLYKDLKKGKWSPDESEKLVELTSKYGVGHWSKVSKEIPHRTGSQCLSKWKNLTGYFKKRVRRKTPSTSAKRQTRGPGRPPTPRPRKIKQEELSDKEMSMSSSSSSSESSFTMSSSDSEDENQDMELTESEDEEITILLGSVPALDSWVPTQSPDSCGKTLLVQSPAFYSSKAKLLGSNTQKKKAFQLNTVLKGIAYPQSTDSVIETVEDLLKEAEENGRQILHIQEEDVRKVLIRNTRANTAKQLKRLKQRKSKPMPESKPSDQEDAGRPMSHFVNLYRSPVDRKLILAVTPWVGNVFLPVLTNCGRPMRRRTQADGINKKLSYLAISSTPIFTLLIQFFHIDAEGCLQMILQRRAKQSEFLKGVKSCTMKTLKGIAESDYKLAKSNLDQSCDEQLQPPEKKYRRYKPRKVRIPAEKPKTVSELLKEKRMQQAMAATSKIALPNVALPLKALPQLVIQQLPNPTVRPRTAMRLLAPAATKIAPQPPRPFSPMPAGQVVATNNLSAGLISPVRGGLAGVSSPLVAVSQRPSQSRPYALPLVPSPQPLLQPRGAVTMLPTVVYRPPNPRDLAITFIVTPQGLIPIHPQALAEATQQMVNQGFGAINMPSSNLAGGAVGVPSSLSKTSLVPAHVPAQSLSSSTSSTKQENTETTSLAVSRPPVAGSVLPTLALSDVSKTPCSSPATTSSSSQKDTAAIPPTVNCPQMAGPNLSMITPSDASKMQLQTLPAAKSIRPAATAVSSSAGSPAHLAGPCISTFPPSNGSKPANTLSVIKGDMLLNHPQVNSCNLPIFSPSESVPTSAHTISVSTSSLMQQSIVVASSVIRSPQIAGSCLTTISPSSINETASKAVSGVTSSLENQDTAPTFNDVPSTQRPGPNLSLPVASSTPSQKIPLLTSSLKQQDSGMTSSAGSPSPMAGRCLPALASFDVSKSTHTSPVIKGTSLTVNCPQAASPNLPEIAPSDAVQTPPHTVPVVTTSSSTQEMATSSVIRRPQLDGPCLIATFPPSSLDETASHSLSTVPAPLERKDTTPASDIVSSTQGPDPNVPLPAASIAASLPPQNTPLFRGSIKQEVTAAASLVGSSCRPTGHCLPKAASCDASNKTCETLLTCNSLRDTATTSVVSGPHVSGSCLPVPVPSSPSAVPPEASAKAASSLGQEVPSSVIGGSRVADPSLPKCDIAAQQPDKESQPKQTAEKYPIVRISRILPPNQETGEAASSSHHTNKTSADPSLPKCDIAAQQPNKESQPKQTAAKYPIVRISRILPPNQGTGEAASSSHHTNKTSADPSLPKYDIAAQQPNKESQPKQTAAKYPIVRISRILPPNQETGEAASSSHHTNKTSADVGKKILDASLISLEEESVVKEWLQGNKQEDESKGSGAMPYLPPSICTLKMLSRLLLQKTNLEENALKLLASSGITEAKSETGYSGQKEAVRSLVEEQLKDNLAYQRLKRRFLSMFTIPGFLAILPPVPIKEKHDDDEELMEYETDLTGDTRGINVANPAVQGGSTGSLSGGELPTLSEQGAAGPISTEDSDSSETIVFRRTAQRRAMT